MGSLMTHSLSDDAVNQGSVYRCYASNTLKTARKSLSVSAFHFLLSFKWRSLTICVVVHMRMSPCWAPTPCRYRGFVKL